MVQSLNFQGGKKKRGELKQGRKVVKEGETPVLDGERSGE